MRHSLEGGCRLSPLTRKETKRIIKNLNNSRCSDIFDINTYDLKSIADAIAPFTCQVFNMMLEQEFYPSVLPKNNRVFGLWKAKGSREDPTKYRPICISPWISKILQKGLILRLLDLNLDIHSAQHAYQADTCTATALLHLRTTRRTHPYMLYVDYKGCFEAVLHQPMIHAISCKSRHAANIIQSMVANNVMTFTLGTTEKSGAALRLKNRLHKGAICKIRQGVPI